MQIFNKRGKLNKKLQSMLAQLDREPRLKPVSRNPDFKRIEDSDSSKYTHVKLGKLEGIRVPLSTPTGGIQGSKNPYGFVSASYTDQGPDFLGVK